MVNSWVEFDMFRFLGRLCPENLPLLGPPPSPRPPSPQGSFPPLGPPPLWDHLPPLGPLSPLGPVCPVLAKTYLGGKLDFVTFWIFEIFKYFKTREDENQWNLKLPLEWGIWARWFQSVLYSNATSAQDTSAKLSLSHPFTTVVPWYLLILAFLGLKGLFVLLTLCSSAVCH